MIKEPQHNKRIAEQIKLMLSFGRSSHAFLFIGGSAATRSEIGMWLAAKVLCGDELSGRKFMHGNHEDFVLVKKPEDRESILVSQIEELVEKLAFKPFGTCYAVLIDEAHLMNRAAQNKLLKTLEEPISEAVIILLTERLEAILPTVRSRCVCYVLEEVTANYPDDIKVAAELFVRLIKERAPYYKKKAALELVLAEKNRQRDKALELIDALEEALEKELLTGTGDTVLFSRALRQAETGRRHLKQIHNVAYTLKQMCLRV